MLQTTDNRTFCVATSSVILSIQTINSTETIDWKDSQNCARKLVERNMQNVEDEKVIAADVDDADWTRFEFCNKQKQLISFLRFCFKTWAEMKAIIDTLHNSNSLLCCPSHEWKIDQFKIQEEQHAIDSHHVQILSFENRQGWIQWVCWNFSWPPTWIIQRDAADVKLSFCQITSNFYFLVNAWMFPSCDMLRIH